MVDTPLLEKEAMFFSTDTPYAPWTVYKSNDKKRGRINALRHVLNTLDYADRDLNLVGPADPLIVVRAGEVFEPGEHQQRRYPDLAH